MPERFINPYTFVPIEKKAPERVAKDKGDKSGYIECSLEIKSPTFIPNTTKEYGGEKQHKEKVFYSYTNLEGEEVLTDTLRHPDVPVIPGSEIRGMLRNVYEQLTNSCFLHIDENNLPYKRTNEPKVPAIMVYDGNSWQIYTDIKYNKDFFKGFFFEGKNGITFEKKSNMEDKEKLKKQYSISRKIVKENGYILDYNANNKKCEFTCNGQFYVHSTTQMLNSRTVNEDGSRRKIPTSNHFVVYTDKNLTGKTGYTLSDDSLIRFQHIIGLDKNHKDYNGNGSYTNSDMNKNAEVYKQYRERYRRKEPMFVYVDAHSVKNNFSNKIVYLAPSSISKEFFGNTIDKILENNDEHQPCDNNTKLCPACRMFGMIGENGASKGKLRFTDTYKAENIGYYPTTNLPILATPRISSTEFYLKPPDDLTVSDNGYDGIWNYDYYLQNGRRKAYSPRLAGRKVYWNGKFVGGISDKGIMNTTVTPLDRGSFKFKIFFDKLNGTELEQLLFCIKPSDDAIHKIGNGKPIGMGQVVLNIDAVKIKKYTKESDGSISYSLENEPLDISDEIKNSDAAKNILAYMSPMSNEEKNCVEYPNIDGNIYEWFAKNRGNLGDAKKIHIIQVLPEITKDKKLSKYESRNKFNNSMNEYTPKHSKTRPKKFGKGGGVNMFKKK